MFVSVNLQNENKKQVKKGEWIYGYSCLGRDVAW